MFRIYKKTFPVIFQQSSTTKQPHSHHFHISVQRCFKRKAPGSKESGFGKVSNLHPSLSNKKDQQSQKNVFPGCCNFLFRSLGIHQESRHLSLNQRPWNDWRTASPERPSSVAQEDWFCCRTPTQRLNSNPNSALSYLRVCSLTRRETFKCVLPLVSAHCKSPSTRKPSTMTTTASHVADLCRAISRPNGWGVCCTCDLGALMMVIKNSCVPASNHSFMERAWKIPTQALLGLEFRGIMSEIVPMSSDLISLSRLRT